MAPHVFVRVSTFVVLAGVVLTPAFGQARGGGGTSSGGTAGTGAGTAPSTTTGTSTTRQPTNTTNPTTQQPQGPQQPIFLSGRVLLEDGSPPTESVVIERVCSGQSHAEGYTDSKGYFAIQLGARNNGVLQDASEDNNGRFGTTDPGNPFGGLGGSSPTAGSSGSRMTQEQRLMDCELRARMAGYRSQSVSSVASPAHQVQSIVQRV